MRNLRVVFAGDGAFFCDSILKFFFSLTANVGKSSIISVFLSGNFEERVSPVLPPATDVGTWDWPEAVSTVVVDTSMKQADKLEVELEQSDVVVLVYAVNEPETLGRIESFWLPLVRRKSKPVNMRGFFR